jgi:peptidoglycan/xylan/chitin deacetylase (PgdA/CDA1 family)
MQERVRTRRRVHQLEHRVRPRQSRRVTLRRSGPVRLAVSGLVVLGLLATGLWTSPGWLVPQIAAWSPRCLYAVTTSEKAVALTIDDGPDPAHGPALLRLLQEHDARATFFLISAHVSGAESVVTDLVAHGHEIGNHLTRDEPSIRLSPAAFGVAMRQADSVLSRFARLRWLRPGAGWYNVAMLDTMERAGYRCALGSVYPYDGGVTWPRLAAAYILANARPGALIVLHEGGSRSLRTIEILRRVLPELEARGYRVVTLSELASLGAIPRTTSSTPPPKSAGRSIGTF